MAQMSTIRKTIIARDKPPVRYLEKHSEPYSTGYSSPPPPSKSYWCNIPPTAIQIKIRCPRETMKFDIMAMPGRFSAILVLASLPLALSFQPNMPSHGCQWLQSTPMIRSDSKCRRVILTEMGMKKDSEIRDEEEEEEEDMGTTQPTSSQVFSDDDCFDLCDAFPEEAELSSAREVTPKVQQEPERDATAVRSNLELHWSVAKSASECDVEDLQSCSEPCESCDVTGRNVCHFCSGTGILDMGMGHEERDHLKNYVGFKGRACPLCDSDGEVECSSCRGSGWVANWKAADLESSN